MSIFKGSGVAIITPFTDKGVNYPKLKELIEWHISEGTDAIVVCGTTGEATTMTEEEKRITIKFTVDTVNKRIPVIAGTGSNNTQHSIEMSKYAQSVGVDALLVITPYYNKTSNLGLIKHFKAINDEVKTPIILYNAPGRTGMNITPIQLKELSNLNNIVAIKEASGNISQAIKMKALCGDKIDIYSGDDDLIVPIMSIGGIGVISVVANIMPKAIHKLCKNYLDGNVKEALNIQLEALEAINTLFIEVNPIPVKVALNLMGKDVGPLRLPLCEMEDVNLAKLIKVLKTYKLI
ncbi:4-hydroxy-tetrahydrodipicolinate synthase [Clostridium gasigenes]|uniref:4-hydroxy-tetrahydrodipicolinate synthase n=1 Tax=Clostridium gasigenes TaxID=94869 RepID=A0A1H0UG78_9CLOT|nr:4-hydroxy-tetrahydrodipicolinate synthase [Clostridium gasigenes]MBB6621862.1 4-hydroxy-tetrahydrodipicolinate synthase [Clostridium gasigenes]MBU3089716.1 4-hydroxy-tetrahydrodipicolinate synthase [Clostridium gasigenes]NKF08350.1 4-hydroxy-tetrahydrodipicolinate synthase [Clostridium gasigenes]QSW18685.1 4-hydroxy-tetrahydrodipicolinate synthase [Clostridium gasigenes]SDP65070.1 4-hydroxy-tetrahydrodipicolinate synthase [Clostridium gasigenes]